MKLKELKNWLKDCNYPNSVINQSYYNTKLKGSTLLQIIRKTFLSYQIFMKI